MLKRKVHYLLIGLLFVVVIIALYICHLMKFMESTTYTIAIDDQHYSVFEYSETDHFRIHGQDITNAELSIIAELFGDATHVPSAAGPIHTSKDAVKCGVRFLNQTFMSWTTESHVGVFWNETAEVWVVHGMVLDRNSGEDCFGLVVLDKDTGDILNYDLICAD